MFSLKLFLVLLAVCICVSQANRYSVCTETGQNLCLCEGSDLCSLDNHCEIGSNGKNRCVKGEGKPKKPQSNSDLPEEKYEPIPIEDYDK
uniref:Hirudin n=1 Tax=Hirudo nipponia TaxID=42736 RepID=A0A5B8NFC8_HIRNI|nr:hirudin [Hirudo nipponia]DBA44576.1 TPA_exp: hirudin variant hnip_hv1a [Hirudo nipponia]